MILLIVISLSLTLAFLVYASASIRSGIYVHALSRKKTGRKVVALTFDDGPDPMMTPKVLDVLRRHGAKATFFLVGEKVSAHAELVNTITKDGHTVGNHTWTHDWKDIFKLSGGHLKDMEKCNRAIYEACGLKPRLFRPQVGVTTPHIGLALHRNGMKCVGWSIRSYDTVESDDREKVLKRILKGLCPGSVILLHDRLAQADILTEELLAELEKRGFCSVTIDEMFEIEAYEK